MNLQPSTSTVMNDRRELFAWELTFGGHGQIPLTGAGTFTPTSSAYVFYQITFASATTVTDVGYRLNNECGSSIYQTPGFTSMTFPANYTWYAPVTSITISSGSGIAYEYKRFNDTTCDWLI